MFFLTSDRNPDPVTYKTKQSYKFLKQVKSATMLQHLGRSQDLAQVNCKTLSPINLLRRIFKGIGRKELSTNTMMKG